jgi:hypothetical protein
MIQSCVFYIELRWRSSSAGVETLERMKAAAAAAAAASAAWLCNLLLMCSGLGLHRCMI